MEDPSGHLPPARRLVRAVTTHQPRFSDDDLEAALERAEDQQLRCSGCGHPRDEVWPVDAEHALELDGLYVPEDVTCTACAALQTHQQQRDNVSAGTYTIVRRRDDA